jgi:hypothetical protein
MHLGPIKVNQITKKSVFKFSKKYKTPQENLSKALIEDIGDTHKCRMCRGNHLIMQEAGLLYEGLRGYFYHPGHCMVC